MDASELLEVWIARAEKAEREFATLKARLAEYEGECGHREAHFGCDACCRSVRARLKEFPLQSQRGSVGPISVPWAVADIAWAKYSTLYGRSQSVERLAQRGGFSWGEMDDLYPAWRDAVSVFARLFTEEQVRKVCEQAYSLMMQDCEPLADEEFKRIIERVRRGGK